MDLVYAVPADFTKKDAAKIHIASMARALAHTELNVEVAALKFPNIDIMNQEYLFDGSYKIRNIRTVNLKKFESIFFAFQVALRFRRALIYTRHLPTAFVCACLHKKVILELHSPVQATQSKIMLWLLFRMRALVKFVVITLELKQEYLSKFDHAAERSIIVLPDAAFLAEITDIERNTFRIHYGLNDSFTVGYSGSFLPGKGVSLVLKIAERLPHIQFLIVGGDSETLAQDRSTSIPTNILFTGILPTSRVPVAISCFDVALLPNQRTVLVNQGKEDIARWTSPLKMFEYMALARPIIRSDLKVLSEVLIEDSECLSVDPENVDGWVTAILRLEDDTQFRRLIADTAHSKFLESYTWERRACAVVRILQTEGLLDSNCTF